MERMTGACFDFVMTQSRSGVGRTPISLAKCQGIAKPRKRHADSEIAPVPPGTPVLVYFKFC